MKDAEDLLAEKERDYVQGFRDAAEFLHCHSQNIQDTLPENKRFTALTHAIEKIWQLAAEQQQEQVKQRFGILLNLEKEKQKDEHPT